MEEEINQGVNIRSLAIKNGLIWGAISVVIFLVMYYVSINTMASYVGSTINILIGIGLAVFFTLDMRKQVGGYWTFQEALLNIFIMFLISMTVSYVFNIIFGKFIEPGYPEKMKEIIMGNTESTMRSLGLQDEQINEAMDKTAENLEKTLNPTFFQMIVGFGISATMYFIGALIFAAIFKKTRPVVFQTQD